ncbi:MAG: hypothetical protein JXA71_11200 [Chitinispirillaceae bacterium]|nr:hypothetical protein [Chitinispirillaceae bacterium]
MKRKPFILASVAFICLILNDLSSIAPSPNTLFAGRQTWLLEQMAAPPSGNRYLLPEPERGDYNVRKAFSRTLSHPGPRRCLSCVTEKPAGMFHAVARVASP